MKFWRLDSADEALLWEVDGELRRLDLFNDAIQECSLEFFGKLLDGLLGKPSTIQWFLLGLITPKILPVLPSSFLSSLVFFSVLSLSPFSTDLSEALSQQSDADVCTVINDMPKFDFVHFRFDCKLNLATDQPRTQVLPTGVAERLIVATL